MTNLFDVQEFYHAAKKAYGLAGMAALRFILE